MSGCSVVVQLVEEVVCGVGQLALHPWFLCQLLEPGVDEAELGAGALQR